METLGSILGIGNIILFTIVFMALVLIPMLRQRKEIRQLRDWGSVSAGVWRGVEW